MVKSCPITKWSSIQMSFEYWTIFSLVFSPNNLKISLVQFGLVSDNVKINHHLKTGHFSTQTWLTSRFGAILVRNIWKPYKTFLFSNSFQKPDHLVPEQRPTIWITEMSSIWIPLVSDTQILSDLLVQYSDGIWHMIGQAILVLYSNGHPSIRLLNSTWQP